MRLPLLDRLLNRTAAPVVLRMLEGASGRRWKSTPPFGGLAQEAVTGAAQVRGRARHLRFNDPVAARGAEIWKTALVGYGVRPASQHPDAREALDDAFSTWADETGFAPLQAEIVDALVTDGHALIHMRADDDGRLRLQHIPAEQLAEDLSRDIAEDHAITAGIEHRGGEVVAIHVHPVRANVIGTAYRPPVRLAAEDVCHVIRRQGAAQLHGLSWFAPVVLPLNELSQLHDALLVQAKVGSMLSAFLVDQNGGATGSPFGDGAQSGDITDISLEPGVVRILPAGWDIKFSNPAQMQQAVEFAAASVRTIAGGLGVPAFLLANDLASVNYSSARTALVQFKQSLEQVQHLVLVPSFLDRVWRRWLLLEVLSGRIDLAGFDADPRAFYRVDWHFPPMPWLDPKKDVEAEILAVQHGFKTRRQVVAERGFSVEELDAEAAADRQRETTLGLAFGDEPAAPINPKDPADGDE